jgi:hypothetical protein
MSAVALLSSVVKMALLLTCARLSCRGLLALCRWMFIPLSARGSGDTRRVLSLALQSFGYSVRAKQVKFKGALVALVVALGLAIDGFERDGWSDKVDDNCWMRSRLNITCSYGLGVGWTGAAMPWD